MTLTIATISFALLIAGSYATDFCRPGLCPQGTVNIGCKCNNNQFPSWCNSPKKIILSSSQIQNLLDKHNKFRDDVACGLTVGSGSKYLPQAKRMPMLKWNKELAYLAECNVLQCKMEHDRCHNTDQFPYAGQNLGYQATTAPLHANIIQSFMSKIINNWYQESKFVTEKWIDAYPSNTGGKVIGHFTGMMQDRTGAMGCGVSTYIQTFSGKKYNVVMMACNYGYSNMLKKPVYRKGRVASGCTTGRDSKYTGLCSKNEPINSKP